MLDDKLQNAHLDHIMLEVSDTRSLVDFYRRVMDNDCRQLEDETWLCHARGRRVLLKTGKPRTLAFGAYVFEKPEGLELLKHRAAAAGIPLRQSVSPLLGDEAFAITDPDGNVLEFGIKMVEPDTNGQRLSGRLQHLVVASDDVNPMVTFYSDVVGMVISDLVTDETGATTACFFRTDQEHHAFAIFRAPEKRLDHHCYEAESWNAIRDWADHIINCGVAIEWGPGRHGAGNNLFIFVHDTDGNWLEVSAELDVLQYGTPTGQWRHEPKTLNLWGHAKMRS